MNILFLHENFPAQFIHLAKFFSEYSPQNNVIFLSHYKRNDLYLPNVTLKQVKVPPEVNGHNRAEKALLKNFYTGEVYAAAMMELAKEGFTPDLIYDHPGWGCSTYLSDIFPQTPRVSYFEWFYTKGANFTFFSKNKRRNPADFADCRQRNLCQLDALHECDVAISPTTWQFRQYPAEYSHKFRIIHDGIDTHFFSPDSEATEDPDHIIQGLDISTMNEIVTYTARGLEPYRGFPSFYKSIPHILHARPEAHIIIMANDSVHYGDKRTDGKTWKEAMKNELPVDDARVHFLKYDTYPNYRKLLRRSDVHVYLTAPFVLSWSMLEAMSCGCLVVASATEPVMEIIEHEKNGFLTSFWDENEIAKSISSVLEDKENLHSVRFSARKTIIDRYNISLSLQQHYHIAEDILKKKIFSQYYIQNTKK